MPVRESRRINTSGIFIPIVFVVTLIAVVLAIVSSSSPDNTDPRKGPVIVIDGAVVKVCDGTTLVYDGDGTIAIPNSPECQK